MTHRLLIESLVVVVLAVAGYAAYRLGIHEGKQIAAPAMQAKESSGAVDVSSGRRVLYWHDPIVPGQKFDKPGKSPFMDMQLAPVYAEEMRDANGEDRGVAISARAQQNLGVRTAEVVMGTLAPSIEAVGSVAWNERDAAVVPARAAGYVEKLIVRAALDRVVQGQPLAELYVPDWVAAQEEFLLARRLAGDGDTRRGEGLTDAARQRLRIIGMTDEQIAKFESAGAIQSRITVIAPISGVLAEIGVREGSAVTAGMALARINGLSTVWINAELPEALAAEIRVGNTVEVRTSSGVMVNGRVGALLPEINPITRTLKVRIELSNAGGQLVPGMFANLRFVPPSRRNVLLIPSEALITTGARSIVMLAQEDGGFVPLEVEPGIESGGKTEIRKGLRIGQRVVLSGQFLLDSEASLKGVETRQGAGAANAPAGAGARP